MCGLTGFWDRRGGLDPDAAARITVAMRDTMVPRGPDDDGLWLDAARGQALGFRRLSIVDLSPAGHQPMVSADGRFVVAYNGEIYNHNELRRDLVAAGGHFRGGSDTEVMVEGFARWGVRATAARMNGMFAAAVIDRAGGTLHLLRDRLGIKPLYWARFGDLIVFGSELKALRRHPGWQPTVDRAAMSAYLRFGYVPGPGTIYRGVSKLAPGAMLTIAAAGEERIERFWHLDEVVEAGRAAPLHLADHEATDRLEALLRDAIGLQMVADVPLGAFLSGGIDSSTVVALMQAQSPRPVRTFTIGFDEAAYDEAKHAAAVARHLGTDHTALTVTPVDAQAVIPRLADIYDEPFADASQIPTLLLSQLTRRHVTVALSGDGGDEILAGYTRYAVAENRWDKLGRLPRPVARTAASLGSLLTAEGWDRVLDRVPTRLKSRLTGESLRGFAGVLGDGGFDELYRRQISHWPDPALLITDVGETRGLAFDAGLAARHPDVIHRMRYLDTLTYLPDDILTKVDRASMSVSLEARVPLLDHRVVELCWRLPRHQMVRNGVSKWLLRQVLERHVPASLIDRPKMGFGVPLDSWLRGALRDWAEDLLSERELRSTGLAPVPVRRIWAEHLAGSRDWQYRLWNVLMLQAWRRTWSDAAA